MNDREAVHRILDAGFLCHIAFQHEGQAMIIPTAYGRKDDAIYLHGSNRNRMMNALLNGQTACVSVTHLDGIVLARSMFHASANYRSLVAFGKAVLIEDEQERIEGLRIISDHIAKGRWNEVITGSKEELQATMVLKIPVEQVSVKIRSGGPEGDENIPCEAWSGHIPLALKALEPCSSKLSAPGTPWPESVLEVLKRYT